MTAPAPVAPGTDSETAFQDRLERVSFQPVFIIGPHRSGTTLLYRVLAETQTFNLTTIYHILNRRRLLQLHFTGQEEQAREELNQLFKSKRLEGKEHNSAAITPDLAEEYCFALEHQGRRPIVDERNLPSFMLFCKKVQVIQSLERPLLLKSPFDTVNFPYLAKAVPQARFVFIYRHPADVINSQMRAIRRLFQKKSEYEALILERYQRLCERPRKLALARHMYSDKFPLLLQLTARHVSRSCDYMLKHRDQVKSASVGLTYSELCNNTTDVVHRVLDFMGLQEKVPQDYSKMIRSRDASLLPEVENHRPWIEKRNAEYLRMFGL